MQLSRDELITVELALTTTIEDIKANIREENHIFTSLRQLEELAKKVKDELYHTTS